MPLYRYTFQTTAEVTVTLNAPDEESANEGDAYEVACARVESVLSSLSTGQQTDGVKVYASIDGIGADSVEEVEG